MTGAVAARYQHLTADLLGVADAQLRDERLISGLVVAAAPAAGYSATGYSATHVPSLRPLPHGGIAVLLLLDASHIAVYTAPERGLLLLDVFGDAAHDPRKALEVFTRRLTAREVRSEVRARG
jgi:S-adenosylmethionine/arginine decarboxylase-like enzyme